MDIMRNHSLFRAASAFAASLALCTPWSAYASGNATTAPSLSGAIRPATSAVVVPVLASAPDSISASAPAADLPNGLQPACDEFCALHREKMILTERRDVERLKAEIRKFKQDGAAIEPVTLPAAAPQSPPAPRVTDIAFLGAGAFSGRYIASLSLSGALRDVAVGDNLDDGWHVAQITATGVELARGKQRRWVR
ncbi:type IV pilus biogenesis protein PilP [Burkholderia gladioli]|uniref:type IV pilus biogenesis protein PilP n=1 Tax=Burkholderia gladioli TaxID=28095 RepID=UPI001641082D|nr:type IV pilus biogenesis protein PilP [Burkholderia gladioli]